MKGAIKDILTSGHRDKMEIMAAMIAMTQKPAKSTQIMDQIRLRSSIFNRYLGLMLRLHLIEKCKRAEKTVDGGLVFQATEKGFVFLETYCDILRIIYGEDFLKIDKNLVISCLKYCRNR